MLISNACFHHDRLQSFDDNWVDNMSSSQAKPIFFAYWPFCSENMFGMFCWGSSGWLREGGESTPWTRLWAPAHSSEVFHGTRKVKSKSKSGKRSRSHRKTELEAERKNLQKGSLQRATRTIAGLGRPEPMLWAARVPKCSFSSDGFTESFTYPIGEAPWDLGRHEGLWRLHTACAEGKNLKNVVCQVESIGAEVQCWTSHRNHLWLITVMTMVLKLLRSDIWQRYS